MYTHLLISTEDAEKVFNARLGDTGAEILQPHGKTFEKHFRAEEDLWIQRLHARLAAVPAESCFELQFGEYLSEVPALLDELGVTILRAEIRRFNNAPTKARAGYYEDPKRGLRATVERVVVASDRRHADRAPLYAQNLIVSGPTLAAVQEFNSNLSMGSYGRFRIHSFE